MENVTQPQLDAAYAKHSQLFEMTMYYENEWLKQTRDNNEEAAKEAMTWVEHYRSERQKLSHKIADMQLALMYKNA